MNRNQKIMRRQRMVGLLAVVCCVAVVALAVTGESPTDRDVTALLALVPAAWFLLTTKIKLFK